MAIRSDLDFGCRIGAGPFVEGVSGRHEGAATTHRG